MDKKSRRIETGLFCCDSCRKCKPVVYFKRERLFCGVDDTLILGAKDFICDHYEERTNG